MRCFALLPIILASLSLAHAEPLQDPEALRRQVESFVTAQTQALPGRVELARIDVDSRLRLPACKSLEPFLPPGAKPYGNTTVGVRCARPEKWSIFVPVQVRLWADVVVAGRGLQRGQTLNGADLAVQNLDITTLSAGVLINPENAIGRMLKVSISGGTPLRGDMLRAAPVVFLNQTVRITYVGAGFNVSSEGRALASAGVGETVQVRTTSGKLLKGTVREAGVVEVQ